MISLKFIIFILLLISTIIIIFYFKNLNEKYFIYPTKGVSNRLRVIMAFKTLQQKLKKKLKFIGMIKIMIF